MATKHSLPTTPLVATSASFSRSAFLYKSALPLGGEMGSCASPVSVCPFIFPLVENRTYEIRGPFARTMAVCKRHEQRTENPQGVPLAPFVKARQATRSFFRCCALCFALGPAALRPYWSCFSMSATSLRIFLRKASWAGLQSIGVLLGEIDGSGGRLNHQVNPGHPFFYQNN